MPRITMLDASVVRNAFSFRLAIIRPFANPITVPAATPVNNPNAGVVAFATMAATMPLTAKVAETERSNPPAMITKVMPQAMIPMPAF